jgi:glycerol-3-phosphate acyltransferase PlsY
MEMPFYLGCAAAAYLLGSVPTGYWLGLARGIDIRTVGSGNIGATNTFRALGRTMGVIALVADILKGFAAVAVFPLLAEHLGFGGDVVLLQIVCALAAIAGHNWTIFLKFKGGKGVATSAGAMLALASLSFIFACGVFVAVLLIWRIVSLASVLAAVAIAAFAWLWKPYPLSVKIFVTIVSLAVLYKHRANMRRLVKGTEPKIF